MAYKEDERQVLRSEPPHAGEAKTVLPDGSYSIGPRLLQDSKTARLEHCLARQASARPKLLCDVVPILSTDPVSCCSADCIAIVLPASVQDGATAASFWTSQTSSDTTCLLQLLTVQYRKGWVS